MNAVARKPHRTFPNPCRRAADSTPRGSGIRPQSTATRGARTRFAATTASTAGALSAGAAATRGRRHDVSTASIRQTGRNARPISGQATSKAAISGVSRTVRNCDPNPAACQDANPTNQPNRRGQSVTSPREQPGAAVPPAFTARGPGRQSRPAS